MTGQTHDKIALASALATATSLEGIGVHIGIEGTAIMAFGALAFARAPDYLEPILRVAHRTWTHYLPFGLTIALAFALATLLALPTAYWPLGLAWATGALQGCWLHSFADALTDRGCWLWHQRRQVLLPDRFRIRVYTIEKRKHWLTRRVTTRKRPSVGERAYLAAATLAVWALAGVQVVLLAHDAFQPPA